MRGCHIFNSLLRKLYLLSHRRVHREHTMHSCGPLKSVFHDIINRSVIESLILLLSHSVVRVRYLPAGLQGVSG